MQSDAADRGNAIKDANAVFAFTLTNEKGDEESWYLDLKENGVVGNGPAPEGGKADGLCLSCSTVSLFWFNFSFLKLTDPIFVSM